MNKIYFLGKRTSSMFRTIENQHKYYSKTANIKFLQTENKIYFKICISIRKDEGLSCIALYSKFDEVMFAFMVKFQNWVWYIIVCSIVFFGSSNAQAKNTNEPQSYLQGDVLDSTLQEGDFINRYGHQVKNYKRSSKSSYGNKKNAQVLPNRVVGRDYYFGSFAYAEKFNFASIAGASISADDEESGFQGLLSLHYSGYQESTFLFNRLGANSITLEQSAIGGNGVFRYFDRAYLLEPYFTVMNFAQVGLGYTYLKNELKLSSSTLYSDSSGFLGNELVQDWDDPVTSVNTLFKRTAHVFNFNVGVGTELGYKQVSLVPYLINATYFGDVKDNQVIGGIDLNLFYKSGFLSLGVSESTDAPITYILSYGDYF